MSPADATPDPIDQAVAALRKEKGLAPLTPEEAEKAYAEAPEVPLAPGQIDAMVRSIVGSPADRPGPAPGPEKPTIPAGARRAMATEPIDLEAIRRTANLVIAPHEPGFFGYAAALELASHILVLLAELARLSRSEAEIRADERARVAEELEAEAKARRARAESAVSDVEATVEEVTAIAFGVAARIAREGKGGEHGQS